VLRTQVPKKNLGEALGQLERVVPSRSSNSALTQLKVVGGEQGLHLSGTNLEIDLEIFVPAEVAEPETFVVPAHLFSQITRSLPGELVELSLEGNELTVTSAGATFRLQTGELAAYPAISFPERGEVSLDARELARSISSVRYAAATEEFRAIFRGVQLELLPSRSRVVATDGFRLAYRDFPAAGRRGAQARHPGPQRRRARPGAPRRRGPARPGPEQLLTPGRAGAAEREAHGRRAARLRADHPQGSRG
jgi:DNA polymerase-3 subunit beta